MKAQPLTWVYLFLGNPQNGAVPFGLPVNTTNMKQPQKQKGHMKSRARFESPPETREALKKRDAVPGQLQVWILRACARMRVHARMLAGLWTRKAHHHHSASKEHLSHEYQQNRDVGLSFCEGTLFWLVLQANQEETTLFWGFPVWRQTHVENMHANIEVSWHHGSEFPTPSSQRFQT